MRVEQIIDAVVIEGTDYQRGYGRAGYEKSPELISLLGTAAVDPTKIGGRHLWCNSRTFYGRIFCSDELQAALKAGSQGWSYKKCREGTAETFGPTAR